MATNVMPLVTPPSGTEPKTVAAIPVQDPRIAELRMAVAARLRAGATPALVAREQLALMAALQSTPFINKMAELFAKEMAVQAPNKEDALSQDSARRQINSILKNRARDAQQVLGLLNDPHFVAAAQQEATLPVPAAAPYQLPASKAEEIIGHLVQASGKAAEPAVHVGGYAIGQRLTHRALAMIFRPKTLDTTLQQPLIAALATVWPEAPAGAREQLANSWLKARHDAAESVADGLHSEKGALYQEAIRRSVELQNQRLAMPAVQVVAPTQPPERLVAPQNLLMDI